MKLSLIALAFLIFTSCAGKVNVSGDPEYTIGFKKGGVYELHEDVIILSNPTSEPNLLASSRGRNINKNSKKVSGILTKGTKLEVLDLYYNRAEMSGVIHVKAKVLTGDQKGKLVNPCMLTKVVNGRLGYLDEEIIKTIKVPD